MSQDFGIADFMKILIEAIQAWKNLQENINNAQNKKMAKKLKKKCIKALKTGKDEDLAAVREYLYIINWK